MALDWPLWEEVIGHPQVRLVKDSSASAETMQNIARLRARRPELRVLTGNEFDVVAAGAAGYDGCLVGTGILNGGLLRRALVAQAADDAAGAAQWQERSNRFLQTCFGQTSAAGWPGSSTRLCRAGVFSTEFAHLVYRSPTKTGGGSTRPWRGNGVHRPRRRLMRYQETGEVHLDFHRVTNARSPTCARSTAGSLSTRRSARPPRGLPRRARPPPTGRSRAARPTLDLLLRPRRRPLHARTRARRDQVHRP